MFHYRRECCSEFNYRKFYAATWTRGLQFTAFRIHTIVLNAGFFGNAMDVVLIIYLILAGNIACRFPSKNHLSLFAASLRHCRELWLLKNERKLCVPVCSVRILGIRVWGTRGHLFRWLTRNGRPLQGSIYGTWNAIVKQKTHRLAFLLSFKLSSSIKRHTIEFSSIGKSRGACGVNKHGPRCIARIFDLARSCGLNSVNLSLNMFWQRLK